jgi:hypothetical protein
MMYKYRFRFKFLLTPHEDPEAMTALLEVMLLRGVPPPGILAFLLPEHEFVVLVNKGALLRALIPAFLTRRRALVDAHCLIIPPLLALVHGYESDLPSPPTRSGPWDLASSSSISLIPGRSTVFFDFWRRQSHIMHCVSHSLILKYPYHYTTGVRFACFLSNSE